MAKYRFSLRKIYARSNNTLNSHIFKTRYFSYYRTLPGYIKNQLVKILSPVLRTSLVQNKTNYKELTGSHTRLCVVEGIRKQRHVVERILLWGVGSGCQVDVCWNGKKSEENLEMMSFYEKYSVFRPALSFEYNTTAWMIRSKRNCHLIPL